tara:strand:+ start:9630 stop:10151 length:522 start_codon:yes stop_codon:yes gene_type:complete
MIKIVIKEKPEVEKILLNAKKTLDGNIIVSDHPEIDLLILPKKSKIVALPKDQLDDEVYDTQKRLYKFLNKKGVIGYDSVQSGSLFMSMEATIAKTEKGDSLQYLLYAIAQFVEEELPFYRDQKEFEMDQEQSMLNPEVDEYTDFDPAKYHGEKKGSLPPRIQSYGINTIYRI